MTPRLARRTLQSLAAGLSFVAALSSARPSAPLSAVSDTWTEIRGTDFRLIGHSSPERLQKVACDLERASAALRPLRPALTPFTTPVVIAAAGERDMRELLPQYWEQRGARPVGAYWGGAFGHHVVVRIDVPPRERFRRILHEYAHFVTHVRGTEPPKWLDEGLSELWTHAAVDSDQIVLGRPVKQHLAALRSDDGWIPVQELTSATELPSPRDPKRLAAFYAGSWALVHYLVVGREGGLGNAMNRQGLAFPTDEVLRAYVRSGRLRSLSVPVSEAAATCKTSGQPMAISESNLLKASALADSPTPASAEPLLKQILSNDPSNPGALEALGMVHFLQNQQNQAEIAFDRAIATGRATHVGYYYRAVLAGASDGSDGATGRPTIPFADYLKRSLALTPDFQPARDRLAELERGR